MEVRQGDKRKKRKTNPGPSNKPGTSKKRDLEHSDSTDINTSDETDNEDSSDLTRPTLPNQFSESNANMMDLIALETRIHEQISNTVRIQYQGPDTLTMDKIRKIPTLHPQMESSKIARIFLSYFYILKFNTPRACQEYINYVGQKEPEKEVTLYCSTCAFSRQTMQDAHKANECKSGPKGDLNRICKLSYSNFVNCTGDTDNILLVRQLKPVEVHELESLMAQNPNILDVMSDKVFYIEAVCNSYAKFIVKLLNGCEKHRFGDSVSLKAQLYPSACGSFTNFNDISNSRSSSVLEERAHLCRKLKQMTLNKGTHNGHHLIILGSVVKPMTKPLFRDYVKRLLGSKCTSVSCYPTSKKIRWNSDYDVFCLAVFESPDDVKYAIKVAQFHHLMGHHVNINLLNVFVNTSTEALRKRSKPTPAYESALAEAERVTERLNMEFEGRLAQQDRKQNKSRKRPHESPINLSSKPKYFAPKSKDADKEQSHKAVEQSCPVLPTTTTPTVHKKPIQTPELTSNFSDPPLTSNEHIPPLVSDNCIQQDPLEQIRSKPFSDVPPLIKSASLATCCFCFKYDPTLKSVKKSELVGVELDLQKSEKTSLTMSTSLEICATCSKFVSLIKKKDLALLESQNTLLSTQQDLKKENELKIRVVQALKDDHSNETKALRDNLVKVKANLESSEMALKTLKDKYQRKSKSLTTPLCPEFTVKLKKIDESILNSRDLALLKQPTTTSPRGLRQIESHSKENPFKRELARARSELSSLKDSLKIVQSESEEKSKEITKLKTDLEKRRQMKEEKDLGNVNPTSNSEEKVKELKKRLQDEMRSKIENIKMFDQTLRSKKEEVEVLEKSQKDKVEEIKQLKSSLEESSKQCEERKKAVEHLVKKQDEVLSFLQEIGSESLTAVKETLENNVKAKEELESRFQAVSKAATESQTQISSLNSQIEQQNRKVISLQRSSNEHQSIVARMISIISSVAKISEPSKDPGLSEGLKTLETCVDEAMKKLQELQVDLEKKQSLNTDMSKRLEAAEQVRRDYAQLQNLREKLEASLQNKESEVKELKNQMESLKAALEKAKAQQEANQVKESALEQRKSALEKDINMMKTIATKTDKDNLKIKAQLTEVRTEAQEAKQSLVLLQGRLSSMQKEIEDGKTLKLQYQQIVSELQEAQQELIRVRGQPDAQNQLTHSLQRKIQDLVGELNNARQKIHDLEVTVRTLHNMSKQPTPVSLADYGPPRSWMNEPVARPSLEDRRGSFEEYFAVTSAGPSRTSMSRIEQQSFQETPPRSQTSQPGPPNPSQVVRSAPNNHWMDGLSAEDRAICQDIRSGLNSAFDELAGKLERVSREEKQNIWDSLFNKVTQVDPRFSKKTHLIRMVLNEIIYDGNPPMPIQRVSQPNSGPPRPELPNQPNPMVNRVAAANRPRSIRARTDLMNNPSVSVSSQGQAVPHGLVLINSSHRASLSSSGIAGSCQNQNGARSLGPQRR